MHFSWSLVATWTYFKTYIDALNISIHWCMRDLVCCRCLINCCWWHLVVYNVYHFFFFLVWSINYNILLWLEFLRHHLYTLRQFNTGICYSMQVSLYSYEMHWRISLFLYLINMLLTLQTVVSIYFHYLHFTWYLINMLLTLQTVVSVKFHYPSPAPPPTSQTVTFVLRVWAFAFVLNLMVSIHLCYFLELAFYYWSALSILFYLFLFGTAMFSCFHLIYSNASKWSR